MGNGISSICNGLKSSRTTLKEINLGFCYLNENQCEYLKDLLSRCYSLEKLNLNANRKMKNGLLAICKLLRHTSKLLELKLEYCNLQETDEQNIKLSFPKNTVHT